MPPILRRSGIWIAGFVVAAALVAVGWIDYQATRRELMGLLRDQALSLRDTLAAAARANRAAATAGARELGQRLLDNARLLGEMDGQRALDQATIDRIAQRNRLFRVTLFDAAGRRELGGVGAGGGPRGFGVGGGGPGGPGLGGGRGPGGGQGQGLGPRAGAGVTPGGGLGAGAGREVLERLMAGEREAVGDLHTARTAEGARLVAGVRRSRGGAIILVADATAVDELQRPYSLESLFEDIAERNDELAYLALDAGGARLVRGIDPAHLPEAAGGSSRIVGDSASPIVRERQVMAGGAPVLDLTGPFDVEGLGEATLRIGMRLDGVRRAERQTLLRLAVSLSTAAVLTLVALGFVALRRQYGELSERHAAAEAALRRRDRLTAMGELASTVAHEVRNPLNAIAMTAQRLRREFLDPARDAAAPDAELRDLLGVLEGETRRIDGIVQQFLEFARPPSLARRLVDLRVPIGGAVDALRPLAATRGIGLDIEATGSGETFVDPDQLRQVIDNLVRNALDATPPGGQVRVAVRAASREHVVEIRDTGRGIDAEHLPKIFDLYFTTKPDGTGVGLALAHQIVTAHGGTIEVESAPGAGTTMTIRIPHETGGRTRA